jgi:uncharacterized tellurite resistance protein B-like protein
MGLFSKISGMQPAKKATDDVLLLHCMLLMSAADGQMEQSEIAHVETYFNTLPDFEGKDFGHLIEQANKVIARYGGMKESVKSLSEIQSEAVRKKCFVLAADIAMSSGDVDESEEQMLETMQRILNIDDELAQKTLEVLALKYAR